MGDTVQVWRCKEGHVLGQVRKNGRGLNQLLLYRRAVAAEGSPAEVDVMAVVQGSVVDIRCDICGDLRTWVPGQAEYERLMRHYGGTTPPLAPPQNKSDFREGKTDLTPCTLPDLSPAPSLKGREKSRVEGEKEQK